MSLVRWSLAVGYVVVVGCGNPASPPVASAPATSLPEVAPPPIELPPGGATMRLVQRTGGAVPGGGDALDVRLGDITGGRVTVTLTHKGAPAALATQALAQGESLRFVLDGHGYAITVESLNNLLVGDDWALLRITTDGAAAATAPAPPVLDERARIETLLARVRDSGIVFIRNGTDHSAADAAAHLRDKWSRAGDRISTVEEFIEQLASRSSQSGEAYRVRLPDGTEREAGPWLREQL